jgi:hypothetical protein
MCTLHDKMGDQFRFKYAIEDILDEDLRRDQDDPAS